MPKYYLIVNVSPLFIYGCTGCHFFTTSLTIQK